MATNKDPIFFDSVGRKNVTFDAADTTVAAQVFNVGSDGGGVTKLTATSTETSDVLVVLSIVDEDTNEVVIGEVSVAQEAGTDGTTPTANLLDDAALPGVLQADGSLMLGPGNVLKAAMKSTLTNEVRLSAAGGDYSV